MSELLCIGCDLDGTLAHQEPGDVRRHGVTYIGAPIMPTVRRVKRALVLGHSVWIFTARLDPTFGDSTLAVSAIVDWCIEHIGQRLDVTAIKLARFDEIWDNKAIRVETNRGTTGFTMQTLWSQLGAFVEGLGCPGCGGSPGVQGTGKGYTAPPDDNCRICGGSGWKVSPE